MKEREQEDARLLAIGIESAAEGVTLLSGMTETPLIRALRMTFAISINLLTALDVKAGGTAPTACAAVTAAQEWMGWAEASVSPEIAYDYLCYLVRTSQIETHPVEDLAWRLKMKVIYPEDAAFLAKDPELRALHGLEWFEAFLPKSQPDAKRKPKK